MSKRSRREQPPPEFFIDRSLGSEKVPERLRQAGLTVHVMDDVYPGLDDLDDEVWIPEQTALGRVLLTKDKHIRKRDNEALRSFEWNAHRSGGLTTTPPQQRWTSAIRGVAP